MKITPKLITLCILLVLVPSVIVGALAYNTVNNSINKGIQDRLTAQAQDWKRLVQSYETEIENQEATAKQTAQDIVTAQAKMTYILIQKTLDDNGGTLPAVVKENLLNRLNQTTVGKTGYIYILDYTGHYILSQHRAADGANKWNTTDANGRFVIRTLISLGKNLTGANITYYSYYWKNQADPVAREKIAALLHFPTLGWVVGISTYYDDLVNMTYRADTIKTVKNLMYHQVIGTSGYIWVVNSSGWYQVSKYNATKGTGNADNTYIGNKKDANGVLFIQEAIVKAKAAGNNSAYEQYPWKNAGETSPRMKIAGLAYVPQWDWIIGVSAYYDDFPEAQQMATQIMTIIVVIIVVCAIIAFVVANQMAKPLRKLRQVADKITDGDFSEPLPPAKGNDEVAELTASMEMVVTALKMKAKK